MNLNRIEAAPFKEDSSSSKLLERFRFKLEGDLREKCVFRVESYDRYIMAYLEMSGKIAEISRLSRLNLTLFLKVETSYSSEQVVQRPAATRII